MATSNREKRVMEDREKEEIGKLAGLGTGMFTGARIGAGLLPVPVLGPFAGAVVGGALGTQIGKRVGKAVLDGATAFIDTLKEPTSAAKQAD